MAYIYKVGMAIYIEMEKVESPSKARYEEGNSGSQNPSS